MGKPIFNDPDAAAKAAELNPDFHPATELHSDLCGGVADLKRREKKRKSK